MNNQQSNKEELREKIHKHLVNCYKNMVFMSPDAAIALEEVEILDLLQKEIERERERLLKEIFSHGYDEQSDTYSPDDVAEALVNKLNEIEDKKLSELKTKEGEEN